MGTVGAESCCEEIGDAGENVNGGPLVSYFIVQEASSQPQDSFDPC